MTKLTPNPFHSKPLLNIDALESISCRTANIPDQRYQLTNCVNATWPAAFSRTPVALPGYRKMCKSQNALFSFTNLLSVAAWPSSYCIQCCSSLCGFSVFLNSSFCVAAALILSFCTATPKKLKLTRAIHKSRYQSLGKIFILSILPFMVMLFYNPSIDICRSC